MLTIHYCRTLHFSRNLFLALHLTFKQPNQLIERHSDTAEKSFSLFQGDLFINNSRFQFVTDKAACNW